MYQDKICEIILDFFEDHAPAHVKALKIMSVLYYDGTIFQVVPDLSQGGDPNISLVIVKSMAKAAHHFMVLA